jgi:hypothetical protein
MKKLIQTLLAEFKWYRQYSGGTWYKVYDKYSDYGLAGDTYHWTQEPPAGVEVIEKEVYV